MGLIFRTSSLANTGLTIIKDVPLTFEEGDGNFAWLATNLSGSLVEISGAVSLSGSFKIPSLTTTNQSNVVTVDIATGQLYYTASSALSGSGGGPTVSASYALTASYVASASYYPIRVSGSTLYSATPSVGNGFSTAESIFFGTGSGNQASSAFNSNFLGSNAGEDATNAYHSTFIGRVAGYRAINANNSNFIGQQAGTNATNASLSNFIGFSAGQGAVSASNSNFLGQFAGYNANNANNSNFLGLRAGQNGAWANLSNFIGFFAGYNAVSASESTFIGYYAGNAASGAYQSVFIGSNAGQGAVSASNSILVGNGTGRNWTTNGIGANNIIIGTNITLEDNRQDSINLGGVIFATGSHSSLVGNSYSGSMPDARVGINKPLPQYTLDVSGSVGVATLINITESDPLPAGSIGSMAVSASNLYFYSGSSWHLVSLV